MEEIGLIVLPYPEIIHPSAFPPKIIRINSPGNWACTRQTRCCDLVLQPCPCKLNGIPGDCFEEPVGKDLMTENGKVKLAGAAMKKSKKAVFGSRYD